MFLPTVKNQVDKNASDGPAEELGDGEGAGIGLGAGVGPILFETDEPHPRHSSRLENNTIIAVRKISS